MLASDFVGPSATSPCTSGKISSTARSTARAIEPTATQVMGNVAWWRLPAGRRSSLPPESRSQS